MTDIVYPSFMIPKTGIHQAFKLAVLHGLCFRMNREADPEWHARYHMHGLGYWSGRFSSFRQLRPNDYPRKFDFSEAVLSEVNRLDKELSNEH